MLSVNNIFQQCGVSRSIKCLESITCFSIFTTASIPIQCSNLSLFLRNSIYGKPFRMQRQRLLLLSSVCHSYKLMRAAPISRKIRPADPAMTEHSNDRKVKSRPLPLRDARLIPHRLSPGSHRNYPLDFRKPSPDPSPGPTIYTSTNCFLYRTGEMPISFRNIFEK